MATTGSELGLRKPGTDEVSRGFESTGYAQQKWPVWFDAVYPSCWLAVGHRWH